MSRQGFNAGDGKLLTMISTQKNCFWCKDCFMANIYWISAKPGPSKKTADENNDQDIEALLFKCVLKKNNLPQAAEQAYYEYVGYLIIIGFAIDENNKQIDVFTGRIVSRAA